MVFLLLLQSFYCFNDVSSYLRACIPWCFNRDTTVLWGIVCTGRRHGSHLWSVTIVLGTCSGPKRGICNLFTLKYDFTYTLGPRCIDIFKANLTDADIAHLAQNADIFKKNLHIFWWYSPRGNWYFYQYLLAVSLT